MRFEESKYAKMPVSSAIGAMIEAGYRQVSRKYSTVSRVDVTIEQMVQFFIDENFGKSDCGVPCMIIPAQEEHYRRCYSKDCIEEVPEDILMHLRIK